ncbi:MAG: tetratricopeptide repeat protein [Rubrivivax sp.]|nr:tetratricopeptide repeat protein [Rubrivivax sp.]
MFLVPFVHPVSAVGTAPPLSRHRAVAMRLFAAALAGALLTGCASRREAGAPATGLLRDHYFAEPAEPVDPAAVFALSPPMLQFARATRSSTQGARDLRHTLLEALTARDQLQLDYDDGRTRNAAEAFDNRAGNCLSLVLMTAAFAKYLELPLRYQSVQVRPLYSRAPDLTLASGHINVVLSGRPRGISRDLVREDELTVDFVPPEDLRGVSARPLAEHTVVAMYMNNRAAETLAAGQHAQAYAWAREALRQDPGYLPGINTLAVIYLRAGHLPEAEAALQHVLAQAPEDEAALSNLVGTLHRAGRSADAAAAAARLQRIQPYPPFHFLDLGRQALREGRADQARELIARELRRQPYQHEAHFWAAVADTVLGDEKAAAQHLRMAREYSGSPQQRALYSAKLQSLRSPELH